MALVPRYGKNDCPSTAEVERDFSTMNRVRSRFRQFWRKHLPSLMRISIVSRKLKNKTDVEKIKIKTLSYCAEVKNWRERNGVHESGSESSDENVQQQI